MTKRIAYLTDIHLDEVFPNDNGVDTERNWELILSDLHVRGINEVVYGGDIGSQAINERFFESLTDFKINLVLGNHDHFSETIKHLKHISSHSTSELYYTLEDNGFKYLFLDSSSGTISPSQYAWLSQQLATDKSLLIFIHHPIIPITVKVDELYGLTNRRSITEQLHQLKNEVTIFCGHYHMNDVRISKNIRQIITPASSYQVEKDPKQIRVSNTSFGYRIIELNDGKLVSYLVEHLNGSFQPPVKDEVLS